MLSHEWRELEALCERISVLRERYGPALRTNNVGLIAGIKNDLAKAKRQRELLVHHISARLGAAAADPAHNRDADPAFAPVPAGTTSRSRSCSNPSAPAARPPGAGASLASTAAAGLVARR